MRKLIAVTYDTEFKAEEVRLQFLKMQKSYLVSLEDAVVVEKKQNGKVKLHQMYNLTASGAVGGGFWGVLIGLIFMNPLLGLVVGAGAGAVAGALSDVGINDDFMKQLAEKLKGEEKEIKEEEAKNSAEEKAAEGKVTVEGSKVTVEKNTSTEPTTDKEK